MNHQSNTQFGDIPVIAAEDLTACEGRLVVIDADGQAALPATVADPALYLVVEGAPAEATAGLRPLAHAQQVRLRLKGSILAGTRLVLAAPGESDAGLVAALGSTPGLYHSPGIALEAGSDGQLLLVQPDPRTIQVASSAIAAPTGGSTIDTEARAAIASILTAIETAGIVASA
jgi:hypothetical protein